MAILIQCPDCREKYKFENVHGGKALACKCGKKLDIPPAAKDGSDIKQCLFCGSVGASDRVICIECGHNFITGTKLKTLREEEPRMEEQVKGKTSIIPKLIPIIKFVVVPAVILVLGYFIYSSFTAKGYGISKKSPLGTFQKFESELTGSQIVKSADARPIPNEFGVEGKIYTFVDEALKRASKGFLTESISLAVDSQNRVVGIVGTFFPPGEGVPTVGSKIYLRMRTYWNKEMEFGKNPQFISKRMGEGKFSYNVEAATEKNDFVQAKWIKEPAPTALQGSTDTMMFALNEYKVDSLKHAPDSESFGGSAGLSGLGIKMEAGKGNADKGEE
jgi:hypothetical protein